MIRMLRTMATYKGLAKPRSFLRRGKGKAPHHATYYYLVSGAIRPTGAAGSPL
jgi:hypothetical protein